MAKKTEGRIADILFIYDKDKKYLAGRQRESSSSPFQFPAPISS
jgi:hypothetical protein